MTTNEAMARIKRADEVERLRARVARLEAALVDVLGFIDDAVRAEILNGAEVHQSLGYEEARAALAEGGAA